VLSSPEKVCMKLMSRTSKKRVVKSYAGAAVKIFNGRIKEAEMDLRER
jgi:hypothetical protein